MEHVVPDGAEVITVVAGGDMTVGEAVVVGTSGVGIDSLGFSEHPAKISPIRIKNNNFRIRKNHSGNG